MPGEIRKPAGDKNSPAGELAKQTIRLLQSLRHIEAVQDEQPPRMPFEPIEHRLEAHVFLGRVLLGKVQHQRSEEHTSELQSHSDLVCRLLLEKKKRTKSTHSVSALHGT